MHVMGNHVWKDPDVAGVSWYTHENNREIYFTGTIEAVIVNKEDVIALAKEFNLMVFEKESNELD